MMRTTRKRQRGTVLPLVGVAMVALTGMATLGVDLARHALTANEAQVVADAAAQAGALALRDGKSVQGAAREVAGKNTMAGDRVTGTEIDAVVGTFDAETREFSAGGTEPNAVRATASKQLTNIFAGLFGDSQSTIERSAVAALGPASVGYPTLPIALSDCAFPPDCQDESCLPTLTQQPNSTDNSGFTGYYDSASGDVLRSYLPTACDGDGLNAPVITVGTAITLTNGTAGTFMQALECTVCGLGINEFVLPIIQQCGDNFNQDGVVYGFATVVIDSFNYSNGKTFPCEALDGVLGSKGRPETVNMTAVIRKDAKGVGGAGPCTGCNYEGASLVY